MTPAVRKLLAIADYERLTECALIEELMETAYQQGRVDGINELARRLSASPRIGQSRQPNEVPEYCQDGFNGGKQ